MPRKKKEEIAEQEGKAEVKNETEVSEESNVTEPDNELTDDVDVTEPEQENIEDTEGKLHRSKILAEKRENEKKRAEINSARENKLMSWEQLKSAHHEKRIVYSRVIAIEAMNDMVNVAVVMLGGFRVVIPCSEMYVSDPLDNKTITTATERLKREKQMLQKLLGAEIPFIITGINGMPNIKDKEGYAVVASRKKAIEKIAARNYNIRRNTGEGLIKEGDIVEATIVSVGSHAVFINVAGFDVSLPVFKLTHRYISDCKNNYNVGDTVNVSISEIEYDEKGHATSIKVSGKEAEVPDFLNRIHILSSGTRCMGRITSIRSSKKNPEKTVILLYLEDFDLPAIAMYTQIDTIVKPLQTGDTVVFSVFDTKDNGYVTGSIIQRT